MYSVDTHCRNIVQTNTQTLIPFISGKNKVFTQTEMDFDSVLELVDDFGTYQRLMLALVLLPGYIPCGFHAYNQLFMAATPPHWCRVPALETSPWNFTQDQIKNLRFPTFIFCHHSNFCFIMFSPIVSVYLPILLNFPRYTACM